MRRHLNIAASISLLAPCACLAASHAAALVADPAGDLPILLGNPMITVALPDHPLLAAPVAQVRKFKLELVPDRQSTETYESLPESPKAAALLIQTVDSMPLVGALHRKAGKRFNTTDGSHPDDFAICYRLNSRMGIQVIPGDPAPVKLPVSTMANNEGVTLGMTWKLSLEGR